MNEAWIRVIGLLLHLRTSEILKRIGDSYGGFIALNQNTELRTGLLWARIFVKLGSKNRLNVINIEEGVRSFELQV